MKPGTFSYQAFKKLHVEVECKAMDENTMLPSGHTAHLSAKLGTARQTSAMDQLPRPGHSGPLLRASFLAH
ncbi:hypothetical protein O3P69_017653 [Scylla paramamosain]|uniref:Uncharacterized protein n=1 Tax=Scylla paramamosain TaxID=85552 RepID=A0AAW0TYF2_SCYPA